MGEDTGVWATVRIIGQYLLLRAECGKAKGISASCMWGLSGQLQYSHDFEEEYLSPQSKSGNVCPLTRGYSASQVKRSWGAWKRVT